MSESRMEIEISADSKKAITEIDKVTGKMDGFAKSAQRVGSSMSLFVTAPIMAGFGLMVKGASDFNETLNKVDTTFGDTLGPQVVAWGDTTLKSFGIAKGTALDMIALFGDMGTSMGIPQDEMMNMGESLVGLAGDLSSFKNVSIEVSQNALKGIFTGETESLKGLGIIMNDTTLSAYALSKGMKEEYSEMSQAEKVNLRYQFVMDSTKNSQGDFAKTSDGTANQMRMLSESIKEASASFGAILLPIITPVIQALNGLMTWIGGLDGVTKGLVLTFLAVVASVGPILMIVAKFITVLDIIKKATMAQTVAQGALNVTTSAFPVFWVIAGIIALIAIVWALWANWDKVTKFLSDSWEYIKTMFSNALNAVSEAVSGWVKSIGNFFKGLFDGLIYVIVHFNIWSLLNDYIIKPFFKVDLFEIGKNVIQGFLDGAKSLFKNIGKFFIDLLPSWIVDPFKWALGIKSPSKVFAGFGDNIGQGLVNGMSDTLGMIKNTSVQMADMTTVGMPVQVNNDPVVTMASGSSEKDQNLIVEVRIGDELYRNIIEGINREQRLKGRTLLEV